MKIPVFFLHRRTFFVRLEKCVCVVVLNQANKQGTPCRKEKNII